MCLNVGQICGMMRFFFFALGKSGSCRRFRDLQKSVVLLSKRAVWTRSVTWLIKTLPLENVDLTPELLAFSLIPRSPEINRENRLDPKRDILDKNTSTST